jgi:hypothetical protein
MKRELKRFDKPLIKKNEKAAEQNRGNRKDSACENPSKEHHRCASILYSIVSLLLCACMSLHLCARWDDATCIEIAGKGASTIFFLSSFIYHLCFIES